VTTTPSNLPSPSGKSTQYVLPKNIEENSIRKKEYLRREFRKEKGEGNQRRDRSRRNENGENTK
jgi:hypothetical protein